MTLLKDGEALPGDGFNGPREKRILQQNEPGRQHFSLCSFAARHMVPHLSDFPPIFLLKNLLFFLKERLRFLFPHLCDITLLHLNE